MQPTCKQINLTFKIYFYLRVRITVVQFSDGKTDVFRMRGARLLHFTTRRRVIFKPICFFREPTRLLIKSDNLMAGFFCNLIDSVSDSGDQNGLKLCQAGIY